MVAKRLPKNGDLIYLNGGSEIATPKVLLTEGRARSRGPALAQLGERLNGIQDVSGFDPAQLHL